MVFHIQLGRFIKFERTVDFVGRHVEEAEPSLLADDRALPIPSHRFKQLERAHNVRLNEFFRPMDRAIHVAFCGKVDDCTWCVLGKQPRHKGAVAHVTSDETISRIPLQGDQTLKTPRLGQLVDVDNGFHHGGGTSPIEN